MELADYQLPQPKHGTFQSDLRKIIADSVNRPFPQIAYLTQGWLDSMLKEAAQEAEKGAINFWVYRKKTLC